jgi:hypothetical protein
MGAKSAQRSAENQAQEQRINELEAQQQQQEVAAMPAPAPPPAAAPAPPAADDDVAQIQKYAALKGQGLISEEEFEAKKRQILGI